MQILNRKAHFNYLISEEIEAGVVLLGSEVKAIKEGKANLNDCYCTENKGEIFMINCHISEYKGANRFNHQPKRPRKLLLKRKEINKIIGKINTQGFSLIPLKIYTNKKNFIKILLGLGKGKKLHDKRNTIKQRDIKRHLQRHDE
ncbi:MAG: SsrA-binding protein SmpB [Alphaproteobacteria bacterium]